MFKHIFLDLDDTLLDFLETERYAIGKTFAAFGIEPTDERICVYSRINQAAWEQLERGELTRARVLVVRFERLFAHFGWQLDPEDFEAHYRVHLAEGHALVPGALDVLNYLAPRYHLYIASNGTAATQDRRLADAGLLPYFEKIFISERVGCHKPEKAYFDRCFAAIPHFRHEEALIIGDSLSSDILGGKNAGIATCWFNYRGRPARADLRPVFTIATLDELKTIL